MAMYIRYETTYISFIQYIPAKLFTFSVSALIDRLKGRNKGSFPSLVYQRANDVRLGSFDATTAIKHCDYTELSHGSVIGVEISVVWDSRFYLSKALGFYLPRAYVHVGATRTHNMNFIAPTLAFRAIPNAILLIILACVLIIASVFLTNELLPVGKAGRRAKE